MPILDITESMEDLPARARSGGNVLAAMLAPSDSVRREHLMGLWAVFVDQHKRDYQGVILDELWNNHWRVEKRWRSGIIAGRILRLVRQLAKYRTNSEPSINKAVDILVNTRKILGKSVASTTVNNAWIEYRPVAHLWAAVDPETVSMLPPDEPRSTVAIQGFALNHIVNATPFLVSSAEEWRQFGENFKTRAGGTILDPTETWVAPQEYELTQCYPSLPPLSDIEIKALEAYRAPASY